MREQRRFSGDLGIKISQWVQTNTLSLVPVLALCLTVYFTLTVTISLASRPAVIHLLRFDFDRLQAQFTLHVYVVGRLLQCPCAGIISPETVCTHPAVAPWRDCGSIRH